MTSYEIAPIYSRELNNGTVESVRLSAHKAHLATAWIVYQRDEDGLITAVADLPTRAAAERCLADHLASDEESTPDVSATDGGGMVPDSLICEACARQRHHSIPRRTFPIWRTCACGECGTVTEVTAWSAYAPVKRTSRQVAP